MVPKIKKEIFDSLDATYKSTKLKDLITKLEVEQPTLLVFAETLVNRYDLKYNTQAVEAVVMAVGGTYLAIQSQLDANQLEGLFDAETS